MTNSQFLCLLGHAQAVMCVLTSGAWAGVFGVLAIANLAASIYYTFKEDKKEKEKAIEALNRKAKLEKETV